MGDDEPAPATVYAVRKGWYTVVVDGVRHAGAQEGYSVGESEPRPWRTACGLGIGTRIRHTWDRGTTFVITCFQCLSVK